MSTHGLWFRFGVSLSLGLSWTSAALGDCLLFFDPAVHYAAGNAPFSVAIGDLDGDRVPDLAVANENSDNVSVLFGVGDGTFEAALHHAAGDGPRSVAIGDLNGDRAPDLVVVNVNSANVSVLLNQTRLGDLNCDGAFNGADIDPFFLVLGDTVRYMATFPNCCYQLADMNRDGFVNGADIDPFFACLGGVGCP